MIFRFIVLKRSHWNDLQFFILFFFLNKKFFSYLSHFSGFLFSKYDDVAKIRFWNAYIHWKCRIPCGFLFSKYDDVAQIRFWNAYIRWKCRTPRLLSTDSNSNDAVLKNSSQCQLKEF